MRTSQSLEGGYELDQEASIDEMLENFVLQDAHIVTTPIGLDYDNDLREVDPMLPKESSD